MSLETFFTPYSAIDCLPGKSVVVLAPHPDDEVFGCAGAVSALIESGAKVEVIVFSGGGNHGDSDASTDTRKRESLKAANIIGYEAPSFWSLEDGQLYNESTLQDKLQDRLRQIQPDLLLAPSMWEMHRDHRAVAIAALQGMSVLCDDSYLAMYEIGVPLTPNTLVDITLHAAKKEAAMACFASQLELQSYADQIDGLNTFRTYTLPKSVSRVEAFHLLSRKAALAFDYNLSPQQYDDVLRQSATAIDQFKHAQQAMLVQLDQRQQLEKLQVLQLEQLQELHELQLQKQRTDINASQLSYELQHKCGEVLQLQEEVRHVYRSLSWRITRPLRGIRRIISRPLLLRNKSKKLLTSLWRALPLPQGFKIRLRSIPQRGREYLEKISHSSNNQHATRRLLTGRLKTTDQHYPDNNSISEIGIDLSIVTYNSHHHLLPFIDSLIAQDYPCHLLHLAFVDNGSTDNTVSLLKQQQQQYADKFASFHILERENKGFGAGHNAGIHAGQSTFILVVNPDIVFEKDMLTQIIGDAQQSQESVACWEARQKPYEHPKLYDPISLEVNWCSHACVLLRRTAMHSIGYYDERIFLYGEDVEVSYRLREAGFSLKYVPKSVVWHYTYESAGEIKPAQYVGSIIGNFFLRTRYGTWLDRAYIVPLFANLLLRSPFAGARKKLLNDFFKRYLRYVPQLLRERNNSDCIPFSFRLLDYEQQRKGAFWQGQPISNHLPLVSIITRTVANRGELLKQAGFSVFNQSYPNIEWVVVEDGGIESKESQRPFIQGFNDHQGMTVVYEPLTKLGRSSAGNKGMEIARGEYLMFLDDDDCLYADHVETLIAEIIAKPHCVAAYSLAWEVESTVENGGAKITEGSYHQVNSLLQDYDYDLLRHSNYIPIQAILFQASLFAERGGFNISLDYLEDWNLWQRYAHGNQFAYVPKTTSMYRTPMSVTVRSERQELLNNAYQEVKALTATDIETLDSTLQVSSLSHTEPDLELTVASNQSKSVLSKNENEEDKLTQRIDG